MNFIVLCQASRRLELLALRRFHCGSIKNLRPIIADDDSDDCQRSILDGRYRSCRHMTVKHNSAAVAFEYGILMLRRSLEP